MSPNGSRTTWSGGISEHYEVDANSNEWFSGDAMAVTSSGSQSITTSLTGLSPAGMAAMIVPAP